MNNVSRETIDKYVALVLKWNKAHNLISRSDEDNIWDRHILNSIVVEKYIDDNSMVVDLGSGGGFPGVLISIIKNVELYLVESNVKKSIFLKEVARKLSLNYKVINDRVEKISFYKSVDYITARGFSSIKNILSLTENFVSRETKFVLLKGDGCELEIQEALVNHNFEYDIYDEGKTKVVIIKRVLKRDL